MSLLARNLPEPEFVARDPAKLVDEVVADFERETGRTLYPAQVERLLANVLAYRESLFREALQDAAKLNLVRYSRAPILDMLGENVGVSRLAGEDDERFRERITLAPEAFSNAGSVGAYRYHAKSAHVDVIDGSVVGPDIAVQNGAVVSLNNVPPGVVRLYPLTAAGLPSAAVKAAVNAACNADEIRPLTDKVEVLDPVPVDYTVTAQLTLYQATDATVALQQAQAAAEALRSSLASRMGADVVRSQWIDALHVYGVYSVNLVSPATDVVLSADKWARCTGIAVTVAGRADG